MSLPQFRLLRPRTITEAVDYLAKHSTRVQDDHVATGDPPANIRVLAGGTDRQHQKAHKQLLRIGYDSVVG